MAVVCDAIAQGGDDRAAVIDAFFSTKDRESPLGAYSIDADGDTTLSDYGGYKAEGGKLVFDKVIKAAAS
jgi:branched-chain amino acid transport system substrate-binding protein